MKEFSQSTILQIKYYVYVLVDPRTDEVFYVGKGSSNRVFEHEKTDDGSEKYKRCRDILESGHQVQKYVVHSGMTERQALSAESAIYNFCISMGRFKTANLSNVMLPNKVVAPCMDVDTLDKYLSRTPLTREEFAPEEKIMLVNVPTSSIKAMISDEDWLNWIKIHAAVDKPEQKPKVILSVKKGIIVGAYDIVDWKEEKYDRGKMPKGKKYHPTDLVCNKPMKEKYYGADVSGIIARTSKKKQLLLY